MYGFGYNGFCQLVDADESHEHTDLIPTPSKLNPNASCPGAVHECGGKCESSNTQPETGRTCLIKMLSLSWDSKIIIYETGNWQINGFQGKNNHKLPTKVQKITSGCLSWDSVFVVTLDGKLTFKNFNTDNTWNTIDLDKDKFAVELDGARNIKCVTGGGKHIFAITDSHRVVSLQYEDKIPILRPINLHLAVRKLSCGKEHTLILSRIGMVWSCGIAGQGQLGHGNIESINTFKMVEALECVSMVTVAAGGWHSAAVSDIGDVYIWGWNERGQLGFPSKSVREQSPTPAGGSQSESTASTGTPLKEYQTERPEPEDYVNILAQPALLDMDESEINVSDISCGSRHTAAVTESGHLYTWGWNKYGQLGQGDTVSRDKPALVRYFPENDIKVSEVVCGPWTTVVLTK